MLSIHGLTIFIWETLGLIRYIVYKIQLFQLFRVNINYGIYTSDNNIIIITTLSYEMSIIRTIYNIVRPIIIYCTLVYSQRQRNYSGMKFEAHLRKGRWQIGT